MSVQFSCSVIVLLFGTPRTTACQASLFITNSWSLLKLMSMTSLMPSTISSSVVPFPSRLQSLPASRSFPMSQFFSSGGQSIGISASASVLPMNNSGLISFRIDWFDLFAVQYESKRLSRVFSNTTVQKHQLFGAQLSLWPNSHIHT